MKGLNPKWGQKWVKEVLLNDPYAYTSYQKAHTFEQFAEMLAQFKVEQCEQLTVERTLQSPAPVYPIMEEQTKDINKRSPDKDGKFPLTDQEKKDFAIFLRDNVFNFYFNDTITDVAMSCEGIYMKAKNNSSYGEVDLSGYYKAVEWLSERFTFKKEFTKEEKGRWKMEWYKSQGVAPADNYWWDKAEEAYIEEFKENTNG